MADIDLMGALAASVERARAERKEQPMTDYTPTTDAIRGRIHARDGFGFWGSEEFSAWLAAHDAQKRAEWEAEQGEVEWEYATEASEDVRTVSRPRGPRIIFDGVPYPPETIARFVYGRRVRRRKAGPWLPVDETPNRPDGSEA